MFDEEQLDPHGECRHHIHNLESENMQLKNQLAAKYCHPSYDQCRETLALLADENDDLRKQLTELRNSSMLLLCSKCHSRIVDVIIDSAQAQLGEKHE